MIKTIIQGVIVGILMLPLVAHAEPIKLKLSYFSSDRANAYLFSVKPFVDAVNNEGKGLVAIEVYFGGAITGIQSEQPDAVADGRADLAIIIPGYSPNRFPDSSVLQLPGLYKNSHEASYVFRRLLERDALAGFKDFFVVGAFVSPSEIINSRKKTDSLAELKGQIVRVNNQVEADTLRRLGATPVMLPLKTTMEALSQGKIDATTVPPAMLFEFGFGRLTAQHYELDVGGVPTALIMNRQKFESLSPAAQAIIRKYSGEWLSSRSVNSFAAKNKAVLAEITADTRRKVISPSAADAAEIQRVFNSVTEDWAKARPTNQTLLNLVRGELADFRKAK